MGYLTKSAILKAYEQLSHLSPDPTVQGATQKVSAIRHFMALDSYYKAKSHDCNTREKEDKADFITHVGYICDVCPNFYTTNFYTPLKEHNKDFAVGSNFYSAGQVSASLVNPNETFEYPKRGGKPLFQIKAGTLIRNTNMYENLNSYIENTNEKVALVVWILRKTNLVGDDTYKAIYSAFVGIYSYSLAEIFFSNEKEFQNTLASYDLKLNDNFYSISPQDINYLFDVENNDKKTTYSPVELYQGKENLVRDSFVRFWKITGLNIEKPEEYVSVYEDAINDPLQNYASVENVFSITDINQYEKTIGTIIEKNNDFAYLKEQTDQDRTITNTKARVWGAHKCYLKFLRVLAATNCLKVSSRALNIQSKEKSECLSYLTALRTKPFMLLAGISGTGKSRIVRKLAQATVTKELQAIEGYTGTNFEEDRWTLHRPANFELIQVKPNWHNSMDVVGYLSNIPTPHYVFTPFAELIAKAWQHEDIPFFLCLDEMNLAPVEEYFAEFLSAIESRSFEGGEYVTDPIIKPFKSFGKSVCADMINALLPDIDASSATEEIVKLKNQFTEKGLTLPKNLIVIGTVNMDETTFSFSRKVLDRAMSVEMNEVDYDSFLSGNTDDEIKAMVEHFGEVKLNSLLVDRRIEAKEVKDDLGPDAQKVVDYLKRINALLEGTPFKLGYRAANEALIYLRAAQEFGNPDYVAALDNFTLMKILSRIEGDENKLKITDSAADKERLELSGVKVEQPGDLNVLTALRSLISQQLGEFYKAGEEPASSEEPLTEAEMEAEPEAAQETESEDNAPQETEKKQGELKSIKKIDNMLSQLKRDHFVSYWN